MYMIFHSKVESSAGPVATAEARSISVRGGRKGAIIIVASSASEQSLSAFTCISDYASALSYENQTSTEKIDYNITRYQDRP